MFRVSLFIVLGFLLLWPVGSQALTQEQALEILGGKGSAEGMVISDYEGISLIGLAPPPGLSFDVKIVSPDAAVKVIRHALALIDSHSPFSRAEIEKLKKRGPVTIVYDPRYPDKMSNMGSIQVALFSPHYYKHSDNNGKGGTFQVIVSRHGVKWPLKELAAVMVHELVGHGIQHLNDRWGKMRLIDMECEAWLYEEMAYQNFELDKLSNEMVNFKRQLAKQCAGFLLYMRKNDPAGVKLWDTLNPDVPMLLKHFYRYLETI